MLRNEGGPGPLRRLTAVAGVWAALTLGSVLPGLALQGDPPPTPAGTRILNSASVEFSTPSGSQRILSDTVVLVVGRVAGVDVASPRTSVQAPGTRAVFGHLLTNLGNAADTFDVTAGTPRGWPTELYHDVDGNGLLGPADTVLTGPVPLAMAASFPLLVTVDVPADLGPEEREPVDVQARSRFDTGVSDALRNEIRSGTSDAELTVEKQVDRASAMAGERLRYTLTARVRAAGGVDELILLDTVPAELRYEAGTLQVDGASRTDADDGDGAGYDEATGVVAVRLPEPAATATVTFQAFLDDGLAAESRVLNTAVGRLALPDGRVLADADTAETVVRAGGPELRKTLLGPDTVAGDAAVEWEIEVVNGTGSALRALSVVDTLPAPFLPLATTPQAEVEGRVVRWSVAELASGDTLRLRVSARAEAAADTLTRTNRAVLEAEGTPPVSATSGPVTLLPGQPSDDPAAAVSFEKAVEGSGQALAGDTVAYTLTVTNTSGSGTARDLQVVDTLPDPLVLVATVPASGVEVEAGRVVRWSLPELAAGRADTLRVLARVPEVEAPARVVNRAALRHGDETLAADSADVELARRDTAEIDIDIESELVEVEVGELLPIRVTVTNPGQTTLSGVRTDVVLPFTTLFPDQTILTVLLPGSSAEPEASSAGTGPAAAALQGPPAAVTSAMAPDSFRVVGDTLWVDVPGDLRPGDAYRFRFELMVESGEEPVLDIGAEARGRRSGLDLSGSVRVVASAFVQVAVPVRRNRALETRTTLGKVFLDRNDDGVQGAGEPGVGGVEIWTEDGEVVTTDAWGKLSFQNLRPGRHAFRLDPRTLPVELRPRGRPGDAGLRVLDGNGWNSGRLSFPVVSRVARVVSAELPLDSVPTLPDTAPPPANRVELVPEVAGAEMVFRAPDAWRYVSGSARVDGRPVEPRTVSAADGAPWLLWEGLPAGASVRLTLTPTADPSASAGEEVVRVAAMRTAEERAAEARAAFATGPAVRIFAPADGAVVASNKLFVGVRGEAGRPLRLWQNDSLVADAALRADGVQDFIGLELAEGPHVFRVAMANSWGQEKRDSVRVHRSGAPRTLAPEASTVEMPADAQTVAVARLRVLDRWGVPVVQGPHATVSVEGARVVSPDVEPSSMGHQLRVDGDGWLRVELVGTPEPGRGTLRVESGEASAEIALVRLPVVRPLFLTGVGQVGAGAGGRNFGALTARGSLDDRTSLTLSYDSRRLDQGREAFGRAADPLEEGRYTLTGDASEQRSVSASRYELAARVERGLDWISLGDVQSSGFSDGLGLARYARSVPGAAARVGTGPVVWSAFGASTTQALRQRQIRGSGISGPFDLGAGVLAGTDQVRIEVRDRENPTRILSEQSLTRFVDYQIDYEGGTLLLKRPAPATDPNGNPVFIVVTWEGESGGDRSAVWGLRADGDLAPALGGGVDSLGVSASVVHDGQPGAEFRMGAVQAGLVQDGGARLLAEVALAEYGDSSDVATRVEGALPLLDGRVELSGAWRSIGDEFKNPSNLAARGGTEELEVGARARVAGAELGLATERQRFEPLALDRRRTTASVEKTFDAGLEARLAWVDDRVERESESAATSSAEARLSWKATERLRLFGLARSQLRDEGALGSVGSYVGAGAAFALFDGVSLEGRHVRVSPGSGGDYSVSSVGVTSALATGSKAWGSYQISGGVDGRTNAAVVGLSHQLRLGSDWRLQGMVERRKGVAGAAPGDPVLASPFQGREEDYWAAGAGVELLPEGAPYRLSLRAETRDGAELSSHLVNLAGDVAFDASLALLTRQEFIQRVQAVASGRRYTRQRSSLWGLAYRPTGHDDLNVLFKLQWRDAVNPFGSGVLAQDGEESRVVGAAEAIWAPRETVELGLRLAARSTRATAVALGDSIPVRETDTQFLGVRAQADATPWLAFKVEVRGMRSDRGETRVWDVSPATVFRPVQGLELEGGYRFGNLRDPDFAVKSGRGWYLTLGTRITESTLPTVAAFWRSRLGG